MMDQLRGVYRLLLRQQLTIGRLVLVGGFSALLLLVAFAMSQADSFSDVERIESTVGLVWGFGLRLMLPIVALVLSSSSLGDLVDDETIVYLWHRPMPRWILAVSAWASSVTVTAPLTTIPLAVASLVASHGDVTVMWGALASGLLAVVGYSGLFVLLGLIVRRALVWGLLYLFIWELFVASIGGGAAKLSMSTYPSSVLAKIVDLELPLAERSMLFGALVPIAVSALAVALTSWRLDRINVA